MLLLLMMDVSCELGACDLVGVVVLCRMLNMLNVM